MMIQIKKAPQVQKKNGLDFNFYVNQMILEEEAKKGIKNSVISSNGLPFHFFKKKPYLSIKDLQGKSKHLV